MKRFCVALSAFMTAMPCLLFAGTRMRVSLDSVTLSHVELPGPGICSGPESEVISS